MSDEVHPISTEKGPTIPTGLSQPTTSVKQAFSDDGVKSLEAAERMDTELTVEDPVANEGADDSKATPIGSSASLEVAREPINSSISLNETDGASDSSLELRFCSKCGARIPAESIFCLKCGCKLVSLPEDGEPQQEQSNSPSTVIDYSETKKTGKKQTNVILPIFVIIAIAAIAIFALLRSASKPNLKNVYNKYCTSVFAELASDGSYLSIDTNPYNVEDYSNTDAVIAVGLVNEELGLPESVLNRMRSTRALDGVQTYSTDGLEVYWTYHPDNGLEVMYSVK